jgi:hypothetical protein
MHVSYYDNTNFDLRYATDKIPLDVNNAGYGIGTVTSVPAGIDCGSDCSENYAYGTDVTLTATPDASSSFEGWSGACTGTGTCLVTMDGAKSVSATFDTDSDIDGISDNWEMSYFNDLTTANATSDFDTDGLSDLAEYQAGTNPLDPDTDGDTFQDDADPLPLDYNYQDGDLDESGTVDVADALIAQRIATGLIPPTTLYLQHGDVTPLGAPDGIIDISDALIVMRIAAGLF